MPSQHDNRSSAHDAHTGEHPSQAIATLGGRALLPNIGIPLDLNWIQEVRVNTSAVERRMQSQVARRTVKKEWQAAWLLRAITCMDLTTLSGDDTDERVRRLCAKGRHPIQRELVEKLGIAELEIKVAAICVYHTFVETARHALEGSGIHEVVVVSIAVEKLHAFLIHVYFFDGIRRTKTMLEHGAGAQVAQLCLDEGAQVPMSTVLDAENGMQIIVVLNDHAGTELGRWNRHCCFIFPSFC